MYFSYFLFAILIRLLLSPLQYFHKNKNNHPKHKSQNIDSQGYLCYGYQKEQIKKANKNIMKISIR